MVAKPMCLTANSTVEWLASARHVPAGIMVSDRVEMVVLTSVPSSGEIYLTYQAL